MNASAFRAERNVTAPSIDACYIEAEYQRRIRTRPEARWGWSFMYTPQERLQTAKAALIGLNPGGGR